MKKAPLVRSGVLFRWEALPEFAARIYPCPTGDPGAFRKVGGTGMPVPYGERMRPGGAVRAPSPPVGQRHAFAGGIHHPLLPTEISEPSLKCVIPNEVRDLEAGGNNLHPNQQAYRLPMPAKGSPSGESWHGGAVTERAAHWPANAISRREIPSIGGKIDLEPWQTGEG